MIQFRCWYCNRHYSMPEKRIGERLTCSCTRLVRVPRSSGGNSRARTLTDWLAETIVYGGAGGLLGLGLALLVLSRIRPFYSYWGSVSAILVCTVVGFVAGFLGGERGINWIGRMIRNTEER